MNTSEEKSPTVTVPSLSKTNSYFIGNIIFAKELDWFKRQHQLEVKDKEKQEQQEETDHQLEEAAKIQNDNHK